MGGVDLMVALVVEHLAEDPAAEDPAAVDLADPVEASVEAHGVGNLVEHLEVSEVQGVPLVGRKLAPGDLEVRLVVHLDEDREACFED